MAYQQGNLRRLATDVANQTFHRAPSLKVAEITLWSYVTDDDLVDVIDPAYFDRAYRKVEIYDIIIFCAQGGWGIARIGGIDRAAGTVTFTQLSGGGGGTGAVASVAGNVGNVTAGQLVTAIDAIPDTNFLTDAERAAIGSGGGSSDLDMNLFSLANVLDINGVPADHLKRISKVVRLTGGVTQLDIDIHANALIILDSGDNELTWNDANRTFPIKVWNKQGSSADILGYELANGARTDLIFDGDDIHIVTPVLDIREPVDKATLMTPGSAVNLGKTPHRTQVLVSDLVGGTTPGIAVCIGGGTDPTVPAGAWAELATVTVV